MTLLVIYACLLVMMLVGIAFGIHAKSPPTTLMAQVGGLVGITAAFLQNLTKNSLTVYFLWQRVRIRLSVKAVTRWSFSVRFDGQFDVDSIRRIVEVISDSTRWRYAVGVEASTDRSVLLSIDNSLILSVSFEPRAFSQSARAGRSEVDHIAVVSKVQELPYRFSVEKIERQILPLITLLRDELHPRGFLYNDQHRYEGSTR